MPPRLNIQPKAETTPVWNPACHITYTRDTWVKLECPPTAYAVDEAKLLCQGPDNTWVTWLPGHREIVLDRGDFYC